MNRADSNFYLRIIHREGESKRGDGESPSPDAKAIHRDRDSAYAIYRSTGRADSLRKIGGISRQITDAVNGRKEEKWVEFFQKTDYHSDPNGVMIIVKSL